MDDSSLRVFVDVPIDWCKKMVRSYDSVTYIWHVRMWNRRQIKEILHDFQIAKIHSKQNLGRSSSNNLSKLVRIDRNLSKDVFQGYSGDQYPKFLRPSSD